MKSLGTKKPKRLQEVIDKKLSLFPPPIIKDTNSATKEQLQDIWDELQKKSFP